MKIWHVGSSPSPRSVDGVNTTVWLVSREQAKLGHQVTLLVSCPPDDSAQAWADEAGIQLQYIEANTWTYAPNKLNALLANAPEIVHIHSIFLPKQATLARKLVRQNIPYILTPNGIHPQLLRRGWLRKKLYIELVERRRFVQAAAIVAVTPREEEAIRDLVASYPCSICCIPNPLNTEEIQRHPWQDAPSPLKRLVYLGRFDVLHKGIDILIEIVRFLPPEIEAHLYGAPDQKTKKWMEKLEQNLPSNLFFHPPVFGEEKAQVLAEASLYVQASRWEVFGISITEAMYSGVPCAIASTLNLADLFEQHHLGLVFPPEPKAAAKLIADALADPVQLRSWSEQASLYAQQQFEPKVVALKYLELYEEVLGK